MEVVPPQIDGEEISGLVIANAKCLETIWLKSKDFEISGQEKSFDDFAVDMTFRYFIFHQKQNPNHYTTLILKDYSNNTLEKIKLKIEQISNASSTFLFETSTVLLITLKIKT